MRLGKRSPHHGGFLPAVQACFQKAAARSLLRKVPWTEVGHLMRLPMRPYVFNRIELEWWVDRNYNPTGYRHLRCRRNRGPSGCDGPADDKEFAAGGLPAQIF